MSASCSNERTAVVWWRAALLWTGNYGCQLPAHALPTRRPGGTEVVQPVNGPSQPDTFFLLLSRCRFRFPSDDGIAKPACHEAKWRKETKTTLPEQRAVDKKDAARRGNPAPRSAYGLRILDMGCRPRQQCLCPRRRDATNRKKQCTQRGALVLHVETSARRSRTAMTSGCSREVSSKRGVSRATRCFLLASGGTEAFVLNDRLIHVDPLCVSLFRKRCVGHDRRESKGGCVLY